jgi:dTDP-4-dehydrorhamnose reductase
LSQVLIFGASGSLGRTIINRFKGELDFIECSREALINQSLDKDFIEEYGKKITAIINCAAIVGFDKCLSAREEAFHINAFQSIKIIEKSILAGIPLLHFSSESVFSCNRFNYTYLETDMPYPTTVYGKTKLLGEGRDLAFQKMHTICRLPMLYGKFNKEQIIYKLIEKVRKGERVKVASDVYSTPMFTEDIMKFIEEWLTDKKYLGKTIHLTSDRLINLFDLVSLVKKELSLKGYVESVTDDFFKKLEKKPLYGGLNSNEVEKFNFDNSFCLYLKKFHK